jgi:hypothetical protein
MNMNRTLLSAGLTFSIIAGPCYAETALPSPPAAQAAPKSAVTPASSDTPALKGRVVETFKSGGYTYINLEQNGKTNWVAVPDATVSVGQEIEVKPGSQMGRFTSKALNRTFESIIFSSGVVVTDATGAAAPAVPAKPQSDSTPLPPGVTSKKGMKHMGMMSQSGETESALSGKVLETMDSGGYTYIKLEKNGTQSWAAVPTMKVKVGEVMELQSGAVMTNFTSKSLNKTFDSVVFSAGPVAGK